jgi:hypothetical protein
MAGPPLPRTDLSCDLCDGCAEGGEPVQDGDTDLEFCNLTVEVPRGQALPEKLDAVHLGFSAASAVVSETGATTLEPSVACFAGLLWCWLLSRICCPEIGHNKTNWYVVQQFRLNAVTSHLLPEVDLLNHLPWRRRASAGCYVEV